MPPEDGEERIDLGPDDEEYEENPVYWAAKEYVALIEGTGETVDGRDALTALAVLAGERLAQENAFAALTWSLRDLDQITLEGDDTDVT